MQLGAGFLFHSFGHGVDARLDVVEFGLGRNQWNHDFRFNRFSGGFLDLRCGLEDRARLHLGDFRIGNCQTATAEAEHRIELVQLARTVRQLARVFAHGLGDFRDLGFSVRQEFVQRRVQQADRYRHALHDLEQADEILALHRQDLRQCRAAALLVVRQDHFAHGADAIFVEEHVFGAAKADAFGAELHGDGRIGRCIGVGAHLEAAHAIGPAHQRVEFTRQFRLAHRHLAVKHLPRGTVDGDYVALAQHLAAGGQRTRRVIHAHRARAGDARLAHAARDHRRMRGHAAARRQNAFGCVHAVNVFR